jgi:hypothetical protein
LEVGGDELTKIGNRRGRYGDFWQPKHFGGYETARRGGGILAAVLGGMARRRSVQTTVSPSAVEAAAAAPVLGGTIKRGKDS